jgi:RimJ/RimL family protein N-acetyltransferase
MGVGNRSNKPAFLIGERVYLRPLEREDLAHIRRWANDPAIRGLTGEATPMSEAGADEFLERVRRESDRIWFVVTLRENDRPIGEAGLLRMFHPWRNTDLTLIIGEQDAWGQGYGTEALSLLLDYAFGYLGFHRVSVGVVGFNERAIRLYEKAGFKKEGIQREGYYYNHKYHDFVMMSILEDEFRGRHKQGTSHESVK